MFKQTDVNRRKTAEHKIIEVSNTPLFAGQKEKVICVPGEIMAQRRDIEFVGNKESVALANMLTNCLILPYHYNVQGTVVELDINRRGKVAEVVFPNLRIKTKKWELPFPILEFKGAGAEYDGNVIYDKYWHLKSVVRRNRLWGALLKIESTVEFTNCLELRNSFPTPIYYSLLKFPKKIRDIVLPINRNLYSIWRVSRTNIRMGDALLFYQKNDQKFRETIVSNINYPKFLMQAGRSAARWLHLLKELKTDKTFIESEENSSVLFNTSILGDFIDLDEVTLRIDPIEKPIFLVTEFVQSIYEILNDFEFYSAGGRGTFEDFVNGFENIFEEKFRRPQSLSKYRRGEFLNELEGDTDKVDNLMLNPYYAKCLYINLMRFIKNFY